MAAVRKFVQSRMDYLGLVSEMTCDDASLQASEAKAVAAIIQCIQKAKEIDVGAAAQILTMFRDNATLTDEHKRSLISEIEARISMEAPSDDVQSDSTASGDSRRTHLQVFTGFRVFAWESIWTAIMDLDVNMMNVIKYCAAFCKKSGLNNPTEKTVQHIVATVFAARLGFSQQSLPTEERLEYSRAFKAFLRSSPSVYDGPKEYPDTPAALQSSIPGLYALLYTAEGPGQPRVSEEQVQAELGITPCRVTGCPPGGNHALTPSALATRSWNKLPRHCIGSLLQAMQNQSQPARFQSRQDDIGLHIYEAPRKEHDEAPRKEQLELLAESSQTVGSPRAAGSPPIGGSLALRDGSPNPGRAALQQPSPQLELLADSRNEHAKVDNMMERLRAHAAKGCDKKEETEAEEETEAKSAKNVKKPEAKAKAKAKSTAQAKAKAKAKDKATAKKGKAKATAKTGTAKKSKGGKAKATAKKGKGGKKRLILGCSKCRFVCTGCSACKNPKFGGRRGHP